MVSAPTIIEELQTRFGADQLALQATVDAVPTVWVSAAQVKDVLRFLKSDVPHPYRVLYDLFAMDERARRLRPLGMPSCDFSLTYYLISYERNSDIRVRVPLHGEFPSLATITDIWPCANWFEREVWDMFGITIEGHPFLERIRLPQWWEGHPLRKEYPARATELPRYQLPEWKEEEEEAELQFHPERYGFPRSGDHSDYMFLNFGPHHTATHGVLRLVLRLHGEEILDVVPDIGYHHRGQEKMAERQTYHTYLPFTDRIDYLAGVQNEFPYVLAIEQLAGIDIPLRAQVIRVMLAEIWRVMNHLVWLGTFGNDVGAMSPVFFTFNDRELGYHVNEAICGFRMHPGWFRIGGVASDLPEGWKPLVDNFVKTVRPHVDEYEKMLVRNAIFRGRTEGVGAYTLDEAVDWGVTGPNLRACGFAWDLRKKRPYSSYHLFDFDIPTADTGDCFARALVRMEEMRQSLRIIQQAADNMPQGDYKSDHPRAMPPRKEKTMQAIETLIHHFLAVSWGYPMPLGESFFMCEAPKGIMGYHASSDRDIHPYRLRIRAPSFVHLQTLGNLARGFMVSDLVSILGSIDFVLGDVDL